MSDGALLDGMLFVVMLLSTIAGEFSLAIGCAQIGHNLLTLLKTLQYL